MIQLINQIGFEPIQKTLEKGAATLMLVTLVTGQPVVANTFPNPVSAPIVQEAAVETTEDSKPEPTVQEVLLMVCKQNGYGEDCAKTLTGMLWTESSNRSTIIGDNGKARGYFQIHYKLHKVSTACAEDLVCASEWTIKYLERNGYPHRVNWAIQCHNGCGANNGYTAKVHRYAAQFWNQPLTITQAEPITLAME
ncbi:hypothetical protein IT407_02200 [Candidatus Uhrbacteria bacterium]|nr:hypothetical protein [Candidatus Uhrbacteria bacterium]